MDYILNLIGRERELFVEDLARHEAGLSAAVGAGRFLVIGGAGSIGQAVVREIFRRNPQRLHVVDLSENNLVELVRDLRSSLGYITGDFRTFALDCGSFEFGAMQRACGPYDYVLNFSALKHVRSEKDPYTLMRMIEVNILNTEKTMAQAAAMKARKYFCVSTDKAANPVNMMGASKRIMEMFLLRRSRSLTISTARFANVAFSDGSLLHGFNQRMLKRQPLSAPNDVRRYFVTPRESGELCLLSCILGENRDIFFPKLSPALNLITFAEIAVRYLERLGYEPHICASEDEARARVDELARERKWPCYFFPSDTTGEKDFEEFFTDRETVDLERFQSIGVIKHDLQYQEELLEEFEQSIGRMESQGIWDKPEIVAMFNRLIPEFQHKETHKYLDERM